MDLKSIIALFMGLVIQFSQVQSLLAADTAKSCGGGESMSCCDGLKSCPCASEGDTDQKRAPMAPVTVDLKWLVSKPSEPNPLEALISPPNDAVVSSTTSMELPSGYAGVPLSVAFCTFVI
jgi:hypothetical protein